MWEKNLNEGEKNGNKSRVLVNVSGLDMGMIADKTTIFSGRYTWNSQTFLVALIVSWIKKTLWQILKSGAHEMFD